jgi:Malate synthase
MSYFAVGASAEKRSTGRGWTSFPRRGTCAHRKERSQAPSDLVDRKVEITGPPEPRMAINALNSGARVRLADLEAANTPHWKNVMSCQLALADAVRRRLNYESPEGKPYRLNEGENDSRHPAHRDNRGRLRDGGDPFRAATPRIRAQRRALGLSVQHHQDFWERVLTSFLRIVRLSR